jgi:H+-transporting ATPase
VLASSFVFFALLDFVKVAIIQSWSFEMTAKLWPSPKRKEKLKKRQDKALVDERVQRNFDAVRKAIPMVMVLKHLREESTKKSNNKSN